MAQRLLQAYDDIGDSTQCHCKTCITTALGGLMGAIASALQCLLNPVDSHLEAGAGPGWYTCMAAAVGAMLGLATCVGVQVREKPDDPMNYFIGGCARGLTLGACAHSYGTAVVGCIYMDTAATLFKIGKLESWQFFATPKV
ncbi:NADH dehydrogenase [ubiquinone] 1 alpha subcomplex subunit 11-like [Peromyscus californicus insignis]|uniref:NADH dehydrogenase [ubiquinone] 1 alpha subcomplex subunit 11-like n=1 Tax=Peromyscus californicus insignis TaxID=564181 RepID=UPI0022A689DD|nr:NADH dehydrogenase [ubiquinone] 1 alpha subcomplex subunit 11-like [Peromyscus californicus insignis]